MEFDIVHVARGIVELSKSTRILQVKKHNQHILNESFHMHKRLLQFEIYCFNDTLLHLPQVPLIKSSGCSLRQAKYMLSYMDIKFDTLFKHTYTYIYTTDLCTGTMYRNGF